ncbi:MAG: glycine cleavage system aminomethyltransferase GcvT [Myxococcota bacterium]|nr:glycine cleavage system aminomethyltransferase GcvT [Myxococcota bacterium]
MGALARTPLYDVHRELGARLVEFGGFEMPVQYGSILKEHAAVREQAGLFDVSHMGQIEISGPGAIASLERLLTCRVETLEPGRVRYGLLCNDEGGVVDDVTVYRRDPQSVMLCVNASNVARVDAWVRDKAGPETSIDNASERTGMLALQGPASLEILPALGAKEVTSLARFQFADFDLFGTRVTISSTGYTGAPGFELYLPNAALVSAFRAILEAGEPHGLLPAGLGARDTLRLEAALPLYGHELDDTTTPLEAGLGRFVKRKRGGYIGAQAVEARETQPDVRALVGFELTERGIARQGAPILWDGAPVGVVTSGAPSPTLGKPIGLGYVPRRIAHEGGGVGAVFAVKIRGKAVAARVVETPFVSKIDRKADRKS